MRKRVPLRNRIAIVRARRRMNKAARREAQTTAYVPKAVKGWQADLKNGRRDW